MEGSNSSSTLYPSPSIPSVIRFTRSSKLIQSYGRRGQVSDVRKNAQGGRGGVASVIAAVFTCRLGVAGTLIGMELTAGVITLSSAIFKTQLMKASHHLASLSKMVRGRPPYSRFTSPAKRTRNRTQSRPRQTRSWLALPLARHARLRQRVTVPPEA
jgi:hypothetical protein